MGGVSSSRIARGIVRAKFPNRTLVLVALVLAGQVPIAVAPALAQSAGPDDQILPVIRGTTPGASLVLPAPVDPLANAPVNYGRPKKPIKLLPKAKGRPNLRPLPPLQPYRTAPGSKGRSGAQFQSERDPTTAAIPTLPQPRRRLVEDHPFDPVGLPVGSLRLTPYVESDIGYDSNPNRLNKKGKGTLFARGEGGASIKSDWSVHAFDATLRGGYSDYFAQRDASRADANLVTNARIDASRDTALDFQGRFVLDSQRAGTAGVLSAASLASRPLTYAYGGSAGITQKVNRLTMQLRGSIDRSTFDNASLSGGGTINLANQDYSTYGLRGRISYEVTPGISPFVDVVADTRRYDSRLDTSGFARSSDGLAAKAGTSFELSRILTGEVSAGYAHRSYQDARLKPLAGPTIDAALIWTASPLTTITARAATSLAEASIANSSGALTRTLQLEAAHALFRNFTLSGVATWQNTDYQGVALKENLYSVGLKAEYNVTRSVVIRSSFTHDRLQSSTPGADYTANTVLLGLRLQR